VSISTQALSSIFSFSFGILEDAEEQPNIKEQALMVLEDCIVVQSEVLSSEELMALLIPSLASAISSSPQKLKEPYTKVLETLVIKANELQAQAFLF
jgi:hypothetical protein